MIANKTGTYKDYLVWTYTKPPTMNQFWFEKLDLEERLEWAMRWWPICIWASLAYVLFIAVGQHLMKNRKPFSLKRPLILWNAGLAIFSIWAFIRTVPELFQLLALPNGFHRSVCIREIFNESSGFYGYLFLWSKVVELGDTVFIVLRKRPLLFLHWFHHVTVLIASWLTVFHFDPVGRWFGVVNLGVHSLMYAYYTLKAMRIFVPKWISMTITVLQIGQMVLAVYLNLYAIYMKQTGVHCERSDEGIQIHFSIYFSYLVLFAHYFYKAYVKPKEKMN